MNFRGVIAEDEELLAELGATGGIDARLLKAFQRPASKRGDLPIQAVPPQRR